MDESRIISTYAVKVGVIYFLRDEFSLYIQDRRFLKLKSGDTYTIHPDNEMALIDDLYGLGETHENNT